MGSLPELRRRLVTLAEDKYGYCLNDATTGGQALLSDPFTTVVPLPLPPEWRKKRRELVQLDDAGRLRPDQIYVRNPFAMGQYVEAEAAWAEIAMSKHAAIQIVCAALGATEIRISESRHEKRGVDWSGRLDVIKAFSVIVSGQRNGSVSRDITQGERLRGGQPDVRLAQKQMHELGLGLDPAIRGLVKQFTLTTNRPTHYELEVNFLSEASDEINFALELAPILKKITKAFGGSGKYGSAKVLSMNARIELTFPAASPRRGIFG